MYKKMLEIYYDAGVWFIHHGEEEGTIGEVREGKYNHYPHSPSLTTTDLRRIADWLDIIRGGGNPMELT
jgi:hypothetical protein